MTRRPLATSESRQEGPDAGVTFDRCARINFDLAVGPVPGSLDEPPKADAMYRDNEDGQEREDLYSRRLTCPKVMW